MWLAWAIIDDFIDARAMHFDENSEEVIYQGPISHCSI